MMECGAGDALIAGSIRRESGGLMRNRYRTSSESYFGRDTGGGTPASDVLAQLEDASQAQHRARQLPRPVCHRDELVAQTAFYRFVTPSSSRPLSKGAAQLRVSAMSLTTW